MEPKFTPLDSSEREELARWISSQEWPFHGIPRPELSKILTVWDQGYYSSDEVQTFWIVDPDGQKIGLIRLFDLDDPTPMFDLRLMKARRNQGLGRKALQWLVDYVFQTWPDKRRLEGTTRSDNLAMRRVFLQCGFVQEGHYREAWPTESEFYDAVGYAILRRDWQEKTTTPIPWPWYTREAKP